MLGRGLLFCAIAFAGYAGVAAIASMRRDTTSGTGEWVIARPELLASARRALVAVALATGLAAAVLWFAFFTRDFSILYVWENTTRATPPWYTLSGMWAGMSGSLLLWCLVLAVYAALFVARRRPLAEAFVPWAIPVLAVTLLFFLTITAWAENPFEGVAGPIPEDGRGMNPLLFSPGMVIHPPMLYAGLVGLTVPFAIAVSALITKRTGADWLRVARRWMLVAWLTLGFGKMLGGAWAYTELGWGGYWGWDPVENASFLPFLVATAFLHSAIVEERRGMLKVWNIVLVLLAASLATFGTFLTRSGLLSSVHAFAESPVGQWFFLFLAVQTVGGVALLAWRLPYLRAAARLDSPVSKEAGFLFNNLLFLGGALLVLWGTILPLVTEALTGRPAAVGPPFFNRVMAPLGAVILILAAVGTVLPWRRGSIAGVARRLLAPAVVATAAALIALAATTNPAFAGLVWIAALLGAVSVIETTRAARARARATGARPVASLTSLYERNPRRFGGYLVHLGVAIMVIGFAGNLFRTQAEFTVSPDEHIEFAGYTLVYDELLRYRTEIRDTHMAMLDVRRGQRSATTLRPRIDIHHNWDQPRSRMGIHVTPAADLYVILAGTQAGSDEATFLIHHNPLVLWVWVGTGVAVLGGSVALLAGPRRRGTPEERQAPKERAGAGWTP